MVTKVLAEVRAPAVSVIIPTYNRAYCLGRAINSVINQTFTDWELIIVDNFSTDNTRELISNYGDDRIKYLECRNHGVVAASRNRGLDISSGEYVAFLDSDDWWDHRKLEKSILCLNQDADFIYHDLFLVSDDGTSPLFFQKTKSRKLKSKIFDDLLLNGTAISNSSVVMRRHFLHKIGGFSEDPFLVGAEDYDAWLRISKGTEKFFRLPQCLGYYTMGVNNLSSSQGTITNLIKILSIYSDDLKKLGSETPIWMLYTFGVAHNKLGNISEARKLFRYILLNGGNLEFRLRALVWLLIISLNLKS